MRSLLLGTLLGLIGFATLVSADQDRLPPLNAERVKAGSGLYQKHCAACHGIKGEGAPNWQKPDEHGELPPPPHGPDGHTWRHSDAMLHQMISEGWRDHFNKTKRLTMPAFGEVLSPEEIRSVIIYLKTLWIVKQRRFQWQESKRQPLLSETR